MPDQKQLEPYWDAAGYPLCPKDGKPASRRAALPPNDSSFVRLYYMTSAKYARSNIQHGRIKVSRTNELNDPFELLSTKHRKKDGTHWPTLAAMEEYSEKLGLVCFGGNWHSATYWAHYADKHAGICLGFDVKRDLVTNVKYISDRREPEQRGAGFRIDENEIRERLTFKNIDWAYERERRLIVYLKDCFTDKDCTSQRDLFFLPFSDSLQLAEVILGVKCECDVEEFRADVHAKYKNVFVYRARVARQHYAVVPDEKTVLDVPDERLKSFKNPASYQAGLPLSRERRGVL